MEKFSNLIQAAIKSRFSDLHITGGHSLVFRQNGVIRFDNRFIWSHQEIDSLAKKILNPYRLNMLRTRHSADFALNVKNHRIRINVFNTSRGLSLAVRLLSRRIPSITELNLHPSVKNISNIKSGLLLICGSTGAGKSTTIASIIKNINHTMANHVITLEDPIEYLFKSDRSFIEQRELGTHFPSYERGLLDVLREDPDTIVVSELREPEAMRLTLDAAESGHLVIAGMHSADIVECLYRFCNSFPLEVHELIRYQLSVSLRSAMAQQLVFYPEHGFRIPVLSILHNNTSAQGLIRDNKFSQIENLMQVNLKQGMFTFDQYRAEYLDKQSKFNMPFWQASDYSEMENEAYYESPLLASGLEMKQESSPISQVQRKPPGEIPSSRVSERDEEGFHNIDDSVSLDDVIKSLNNIY
jgi:twitching motility protein PilT